MAWWAGAASSLLALLAAACERHPAGAATPAGPGILLLDWADARRAERYKVEAIIPPATDWAEIVQVPGSDATLTGLTTGAAISLRVLSANPAGYAQPSEPITATVP